VLVAGEEPDEGVTIDVGARRVAVVVVAVTGPVVAARERGVEGCEHGAKPDATELRPSHYYI
jgi:hypothetical protein